MLNKVVQVLKAVREKTPLVQAITNYVTINDCANILLCAGASPAMVECNEEVEEFVPFISSLYINIGTLTKEQELAATHAVRKAAELNKPVILDPVACGAIPRKMRVIERFREMGRLDIIKGNIGEIKHLAGFAGKLRGVDSIDDGEGAVEASVSLANSFKTVVVTTGKTDIITDGSRTCLVENGSEMLTMITGAGCMTGALAAATAAVCDDRYVAAIAATVLMSLAGEKAANSIDGILPGSFRVKLFDYIYSINEDDIMKGGKIKCL